MNFVIDRYKRIRKNNFLKQQKKVRVAFIGFGLHVMDNVYPLIQYLNAEVKYIVSKSEESAMVLSDRFPHIHCLTDIETVFSDKEVDALIISTHPKAHQKLVREALAHDKQVFVEKPLSYSLPDLYEIRQAERNSGGNVQVGLQKRFTPVTQYLKQHVQQSQYYHYRYCTGAYPEGNALYELFIHPIDLACYLFGEARLVSFNSFKGQSMLLHVEHKNGTIGSLELSTDYSWHNPVEELMIQTSKYIYESKHLSSLSRTSKPKKLASIPLDKIGGKQGVKEELFRKNPFAPVRNQNELYTSGYYNELQSFLSLCAKDRLEESCQASVASLLPTYKLLDQIGQQNAKGLDKFISELGKLR